MALVRLLADYCGSILASNRVRMAIPCCRRIAWSSRMALVRLLADNCGSILASNRVSMAIPCCRRIAGSSRMTLVRLLADNCGRFWLRIASGWRFLVAGGSRPGWLPGCHETPGRTHHARCPTTEFADSRPQSSTTCDLNISRHSLHLCRSNRPWPSRHSSAA